MKKVRYILTLVLGICFIACTEKELEPITASKGKPQSVVVDKIESIPGGAKIVYEIPDSEDLMMVKAMYTITNGKNLVAVASKYENTITLLGYNDIEEYDVTLVAVNYALKESDPITVKVRPEKSPLKQIEESFEILPDFGGARFTWENKENAPITIDLLAADDDGYLRLSRIYYTSASAAYQALRGYDPEPRVFAAVLRDMYDNQTDTIFSKGGITIPILEMQVDKKGMQMFTIEGDGDFNIYGTRDYWMFDGDVETFAHSSAPPAVFTFDLGIPVRLSRFKVWNRKYEESYYHWGNLRYFKVYGRLDTPPRFGGGWDGWELIAECEQTKPSGIADTKKMTDEDVAFAESGFEFEIDFDMPVVRYLRFSVEETWSGTSFAHPAEFTFWGQY